VSRSVGQSGFGRKSVWVPRHGIFRSIDADGALPTRHVRVNSQGIPDGSQDHSQGNPDTRKVRAEATKPARNRI
jgi:hypothetical protein